MKKNIKHFIHIFIFAILLIIVLTKVTDILEYKYGKNKCETFFEKADEIDIVFLGTSHVINSVFPMDLYKEYGMVSYNMGFYSSRMPVVYHTFKNILDYCQPELIVLDVFTVLEDIKIHENLEQLHRTFDGFPISKNKVEAINYLLDTFDQKVEYIFTLSKYHGRWNELTINDFVDKYNVTKGSEAHKKVYTGLRSYETYITDEIKEFDTIGLEYLEKILQLAKEKNIEVLLTCIPHAQTEEMQMQYNYINVIADKYGVNYYDIYSEDIINWTTDMYDDTHLNMSGATKVTSALGEYIMNNYDVGSYREAENHASWDEDYETYLNDNIATLNEYASISIYTYLMLLNVNGLECSIELSEKLMSRSDALLFELIDNIKNCEEVSVVDNTKKDITITVRKVSTGEIVSQKSYNYAGEYKLVK